MKVSTVLVDATRFDEVQISAMIVSSKISWEANRSFKDTRLFLFWAQCVFGNKSLHTGQNSCRTRKNAEHRRETMQQEWINAWQEWESEGEGRDIVGEDG